MSNFYDYDFYIRALHTLDKKLKNKIEIKAIGGFSLLANAKYTNFYMTRSVSQDIDNINTIDNSLKILIREVAKEMNIDNHWLNSKWSDKNPKDPITKDVKWVEINENFSNISLKIADLESLFNYKIRSLGMNLSKINYPFVYGNVIDILPHARDVQDIIDILNFYKEKDIYNLKNIKIRKDSPCYELAIRMIGDYDLLN